ncbi:MAG: hypothetical protein ACXU86_08130, partial [Archangium sp.]
VMAAAEAVLDEIHTNGAAIYQHLRAVGDTLACGLGEIFRCLGRAHVVQHVGPMVSLFLTTEPVEGITEYRQARTLCDLEGYIQFQHVMQRSGVYFHPNLFEPMFLSTTHSNEDIAIVLERMEQGARACQPK